MFDNYLLIIGKKIKKIRLKNNLTIYELGKKSKLSKNTIIKIEKGGANPTIKTLNKLTRALKIRINSLTEDL